MEWSAVDRFGPDFAEQRLADRPDDAQLADRPPVDNGIWINQASCTRGIDHGVRQGGTIFRIQLVEIEDLGFPIFMDADDQVDIRQTLQPGDMGANFSRLRALVFAVEVNISVILAGALEKPRSNPQTETSSVGRWL